MAGSLVIQFFTTQALFWKSNETEEKVNGFNATRAAAVLYFMQTTEISPPFFLLGCRFGPDVDFDFGRKKRKHKNKRKRRTVGFGMIPTRFYANATTRAHSLEPLGPNFGLFSWKGDGR